MAPLANDTEIPFLVNPDNAPFLDGRGLAVPQRFSDGRFDLIIGAVLGGSPILLLFLISILQVNLGEAAVLIIAAALGAAAFGFLNLRSGWRSVQLARAYRTDAHPVYGTFTALELIDEGSGDWFLRGECQFEDEAGNMQHTEFSQYRPDLVGKPLPPVGTRAVVLVLNSDQHTIL